MTTDPSGFTVLSAARYASLVTFRKNGSPVSTPVWIAPEGNDLVVVSIDGVGKVKRLANDPRVELQECTVRGTVVANAPVFHGIAVVQRADDELAVIRRAINSKYLLSRIGGVFQRLGAMAGRPPKHRVGIRITVTD